jgi:hypothetical protein
MTLTVNYQLVPTKPAFANDDSAFYNGFAFDHQFWADETTPDILGLSNGGYVEATNSIGDDQSTNYLYLTFYNSNYTLLSAPYAFPLNGNERMIGQPSLTQLANGNVLVVWKNIEVATPGLIYPAAHVGLEGALYSPTGGYLGRLEFGANDLNYSDPQVAALPGGDFVISYNYGITATYNLFRSDGVSKSGGSAGNNFSSDTAVAALADGGFVVTYSQSFAMADHDIFTSIYNANGTPRVTKLGLAFTGSDELQSKVVGLPNGGFAVVYQDYHYSNETGSSGISLKIVLANGFDNTPGGTIHVNTPGVAIESDPDVTVLANGFIVVSWTTTQPAGGSDINGRIYDQSGNPVTGQFSFASTSKNEAFSALSHLTGGAFGATWQTSNNNDHVNDPAFTSITTLVRNGTGNGGDDTFVGDQISDNFLGGAGNDTFVFKPGGGGDRWDDFTVGAGTPDRIDISAFDYFHSADEVISHSGQFFGLAILNFGPGPVSEVKDAIGVLGVDYRDLSNDDFIFAQPVLGSSDYDANGHGDILWRRDNGAISIWDNGDINHAHVIANPGVVPTSWRVAGSGDFDGNGHKDILWRNDNGSVSIWDNGDINGAHIVSGAGVVANSWRVAATGDFDGNSRSDILWRNDSGAVSIWDKGNIANAHIIANAGVVPKTWHIAGTGNFDGIGGTDILWWKDDGSVSIWDNGNINNAHIISNAGAVAASWHIVATGDFAGDGRADILWRNDNGAISIWDNGNVANAHIIAEAGVVASSWHIAGVGDFAGDGHADILWHNDNGATSIWDNGTLAGAHLIANPGIVPNDWHIA